jgi:hypothetical protein
VKFRSKFEKTVYDTAKKSRKKIEYEPSNPRFNYVLESRYYPDFRLPNGIYIETKGFFKAADRRKMIAVKLGHQRMDIRFVFQRASNKLTKARGSKTYGEWAEYHGFKWAEGTIPLAWWKEKGD